MSSEHEGDELLKAVAHLLMNNSRPHRAPGPGMIEATLMRHGVGRAELPEDVKPYYEDMLTAGCMLDAVETSEDVFDLCITKDGKRISELKKGIGRGPEISAQYAILLRQEPWLKGVQDG